MRFRGERELLSQPDVSGDPRSADARQSSTKARFALFARRVVEVCSEPLLRGLLGRKPPSGWPGGRTGKPSSTAGCGSRSDWK